MSLQRQTEHVADRVLRDALVRIDRNVAAVDPAVGSCVRWYGDPEDPPAGWIRVTGERLKTSLFPALFAALGHRYRSATDSVVQTDFRLPPEIPNETWIIRT